MITKVGSTFLSRWKPKIAPQININIIENPQSIHFCQPLQSLNQFRKKHEFQRFFTKKSIKLEQLTNDKSPKATDIFFDSKKSKEYEIRCEQGDIQAILDYGTSLLDGKNGLNRDPSKAVKYFKIGSDNGDTECMFMYAICLFYGEGVKTDFTTAFKLFKETAARGKLDSEFYLYQCYLNGNGVEKNADEAYRYLKKSAESGFPSSCTILALQLPDSDPKKGVYLKKAAESGEQNAELLYGFSIIEKDVKNGLFYIKKSADEGNKVAQQFYGTYLFEGKFVQKDYEKAAHYFHLAAEQQSPEGCYGYSHALMKQKKVDKQKAFEYMKKAADLGHVDAMIELVGMIVDGYTTIENDPQVEIMKYIKKAVERGSATAMTMYAMMAEKGTGFDKPELEIAAEYFKKAADTKNAKESIVCYLDFLRRHNKFAEMKKYLKIGADAGDGECQFNHGLDLYLDGKEEESDKYLKMAISNGNVDAMNLYASRLIEKNPSEALSLLKKAIEEGSLTAMFNYANFLSEGKFPMIKDAKQEAFKFMKKAADSDFEGAVITVGKWLFYGNCCEKNIKESMKYLKLAADKFNDSDSQYMIGFVLVKGYDGYKKNLKEGIQYLKKAADQQNPGAINALGCTYLDGIGVKKNEYEAVKYFKKAADMNDSISINQYAICLYSGIGIEKDEKEAAKYFKKGADLGNPSCMYNLGMMHMMGVGVEKNHDEGEKYLKMAKQNGYEHALEVGEHVFAQDVNGESIDQVKEDHSPFLSFK